MEVLQRTANRGSISTGYDIDNSLKFESDNSEYLKAEGRPAGNQQTWTWSCWLKRTEVNNGVVAQYMFSAGSDGKLGLYFRDDSSSTGGDTIFIYVDEGNSLKWIGELRVSFRDTSAWYHIVFAVDSTDGTAADRTKIYVNGVQQTITFNATLNQNSNTRIGDSGGKLSIGAKMDGSYEFNGYMAEVVLVDGSQLTPTSFGEFDDDSGIWKPKDVSSLSLGNAGFYMNFDDSSNLGKVQTGTNQGNFDLYNIAAADQATDTPTNNFCTWLPLWTYTNMATIGNGGTSSIGGGGSVWRGAKGSMGVSKGKWYWEQKASGSDTIVGWQTDNCISASGSNSHNVLDTVSFYEGGNFLWIKDSTSGRNADSASGTHANGQIVGCALNLDSDPQTVTFYRNGSAIISDRNIDGLANKTLFPQTSHYNQTSDANFGGYTNFTISSAASDANGYGTFEYAPPSGYYALCTKNLAEFG